jgi:hypothetical protein
VVDGWGPDTCQSTWPCLLLSNGASIYYANGDSFAGTATLNGVWFHIDTDAKVTPAGPGSEAVVGYLYYNGRITTAQNAVPNTQSQFSGPVGPAPGSDPSWFNWN